MFKKPNNTSLDKKGMSGLNETVVKHFGSSDNPKEFVGILRSIPSANINYKGYSKDQMQLRLSSELTHKMTIIEAAMAILDEVKPFMADDLVNQIMKEYIAANQEGLKSMLKAASSKTLKKLAQNELDLAQQFNSIDPTQK